MEVQATRFAELYQLTIAKELGGLHQQVDVEDYLQTLRDQVKEDMGFMPGSPDLIAFDVYLAQIENKPNTMAGCILQNT